MIHHLTSYNVCVSREGSGEIVQMCKLDFVFTAPLSHLCDKYQRSYIVRIYVFVFNAPPTANILHTVKPV